uniref:Importin N-terminal domain-containing protein n=1 Tax=Aureoumbra lagunensis TaxID=44058 RepID=A0A7S3JXU8_9STRA|mmetsp:Transcript_13096/g.17522  ORF Transcript_13096/g.17522 Transcript_13096/m.17522 type:complete len:1178 (-) Transcript_13096:818-4351(-)
MAYEALLFNTMDEMLYAMQESNNEGRRAAEKAFTAYCSSNPQQCAHELIECLSSAKLRDAPSETLCAVLLRRFTARYRESDAWNAEAIDALRNGMCQAASRNGLSAQACRQLQYAMASEAAYAGWPQLSLWALEGIRNSQESVLELVTALATEGDSAIGERAQEIAHGLLNHFFAKNSTISIKQKGAVVKAAVALATSAGRGSKNEDQAQRQVGQVLLLPCLQVCAAIANGDDDERCNPLEAMLDAAVDTPGFFLVDIDAVVALSRRCALDSGRLEMRSGRTAFEISVTLAERVPEAFFNGTDSLPIGKTLIELALQVAAARSSACFWFQTKCPVAPLADEEDDDGERQAEFLATVSADTSLKRLAALAPAARSQMLQWVDGVCGASEASLVRAALAALHAVTLADSSCLSEWRGSSFGLAFATDAIRRHASLPEALEACRVISAIGATCNLDDESHETIAHALFALAALGQQCATQNQPRMAGACTASLALLLIGNDDDDDENYEEYDDDDEDLSSLCRAAAAGLQACLPLLGSALDSALRNGDANLARHCLDAVAAVATKAGRRFEPYYTNFMPPLIMLLEAPIASTLEASLVRAAAATSAARIGAAVGRDRFGIDANRVLQAALCDIRREFNEQQNDEQDGELILNDLVPTAMRLARLDPDLVLPFIHELAAPPLRFATEQAQVWDQHIVMPGETELSATQKKKGITEFSLGDDVRIRVDLGALWKKEKASELLGELCSAMYYRLPQELVQPIAGALIPIITLAGAPGARSAAVVALSHLCGALVSRYRRDPVSQKSFVMEFVLSAGINTVAGALQSEHIARPRASAAQALAAILEHISDAAPGGYETARTTPLAQDIDPIIIPLATALTSCAAKALQEKEESQQQYIDDEDDDDEAYSEALHSNIVNGLCALFKLAPNKMSSFFESSIAPVYGPHLATPDDPAYESALCVFADAIQYLPSFSVVLGPGVAAAAANALCNDDLTHLHATAAYVTAVIARALENSGSVPPVFSHVLPILQRLAFDNEATEASDAGYRIRDNAANAVYALANLSVLIPNNDARTQLIANWIQNALPLRRDMEEARRANRALLDLCQHPVLSTHARAKLAESLEATQQKPDDFNDFPDPPEASMDQQLIESASLLLGISSAGTRAIADPKQRQLERRPLTSMAPNVS